MNHAFNNSRIPYPQLRTRPSAYFFESRLFNGLRPIQINILPSRLNSRLRLCSKRLNSNFPVLFQPPLRVLPDRRVRPRDWERYSTNSVFVKHLLTLIAIAIVGWGEATVPL